MMNLMVKKLIPINGFREILPSWPKDRSVCTPTYEMKNGIIRLIIDKNSKNEFDNGMYISGFMSASRTGLHHYDPKKKHFTR